ncbi:MAG: hypothetical protein ACI36W_02620 [Coriobacteriales bacterium]
MKSYVEDMLHTDVETQPMERFGELPLYLRGLFELERWGVFGVEFAMARPLENLAVKTLAKHRSTLEDALGIPVAFALDAAATGYRLDRMVEAGLPFVADGRQVYLPFLGVALSKAGRTGTKRPSAAAEKLSPQAQRLALKVVYGKIGCLTVTQAAELLGVAKMTASRAFSELEAVNPSWVASEGRQRRLCLEGGMRGFWRQVEPHLPSPVVREHRLESIPEARLALGGMSAVCHHSMLADNPWPTFAITRAQEQELGLRDGEHLAGWDSWEQPACVVQVMRYELDSLAMGEEAIDPLSAVLSLTAEEREDPRVAGEIEIIMERVFDDEHERD